MLMHAEGWCCGRGMPKSSNRDILFNLLTWYKIIIRHRIDLLKKSMPEPFWS